MYHSQASAFNIYDATPFKRDPLAELAKACAAHGMKLGFYYSQAQDWNHPGGAAIGGHWDAAQEGSMDDYIRTIAVPQVRELLTGYGPVSVLWWDTPEGMTPARSAPLQALLKLQPNIIANDRLGNEPGDTSTPEQHIPSTGMPGRDWETCMTINNTWGYKTDDTDFKSTETLLHNLIDIASKGGNYLLNVGPTSLGEIPQPEVDRLKQIGQWLATNGDAIYGTTASPFRRYSFDGRCTVKGNRLFVHAFNWPADGIRIVGLKTKVTAASFIDGGAAADVAASTDDGGLPVLTIRPPAHPDLLATVVALDLAGPPDVDSTNAMVRAGADGVIDLSAEDATLNGSQLQMEGDHIGYWTNATDTISWDVIAPAAGDYAVQITYACDDRAAGSEYVITAGDSTASGSILPTGSWGSFVTKASGQLHLKAGPQRVTVSAVSMPRGAVMNLKELRLSPVR
jgi:alpha-L-fucosidase